LRLHSWLLLLLQLLLLLGAITSVRTACEPRHLSQFGCFQCCSCCCCC
jgi:hypothetical protein